MVYKFTTITAAGTDTTIVEVPSNVKYKIVGLVITNRAAANATVEIYDGPSADGNIKARIIVGTGETKEFVALKPVFEKSIVVVSDQADVDVMADISKL